MRRALLIGLLIATLVGAPATAESGDEALKATRAQLRRVLPTQQEMRASGSDAVSSQLQTTLCNERVGPRARRVQGRIYVVRDGIAFVRIREFRSVAEARRFARAYGPGYRAACDGTLTPNLRRRRMQAAPVLYRGLGKTATGVKIDYFVDGRRVARGYSGAIQFGKYAAEYFTDQVRTSGTRLTGARASGRRMLREIAEDADILVG